MQIPSNIRNELVLSLNKLDDCRATLEAIVDDMIEDQEEEFEDTLDALRDEIQDWLSTIYHLDTDIAQWTVKDDE